MPFTLRALVEGVENKDLAKQMRLGMVECLNHQLLQPYPVLHEKSVDLVAQVRWRRRLVRHTSGYVDCQVVGQIGTNGIFLILEAALENDFMSI